MGFLNCGVEVYLKTGTTAATTSVTVPFSLTATKGTLLVSCFTHNNYNSGANVMSAPSGWTQVGVVSFAAGNRATYLFAKWSDGTETQVVGSQAAATGFAGAVLGLTGLKSGPTISQMVNENYAMSSNAAAIQTFMSQSGTKQWDTYGQGPIVVVSGCGASASLAAVPYFPVCGIPGSTPSSLEGSLTGASNSTSVGLYAFSSDLGPTTDLHLYWAGTTARATGIVSMILRPRNGVLTSMGIGA